jgi:hypothetical protein
VSCIDVMIHYPTDKVSEYSPTFFNVLDTTYRCMILLLNLVRYLKIV